MKSELKAERVRKCFVEAAKEIIRREGVEQATIRRVAEGAGYSYATLYNYFADIGDLLWQVREALVLDIATAIREEAARAAVGADDLRGLMKLYIAYHLKAPNLFRFLYVYQLPGAYAGPGEAVDGLGMAGVWQRMLSPYGFSEQQAKTVSAIILYAVHGMLTLSLTDSWDLRGDRIDAELDAILDYLLQP